MVRMILEGMDRDNTGINYIATSGHIPAHVTSVEITFFGGGLLKLVGKVEGNAYHEVNVEGTLTAKMQSFFESTQTIITEDGRVYSHAREERLQSALKDILEHAGGFESAYRQISENPGKFYRF